MNVLFAWQRIPVWGRMILCVPLLPLALLGLPLFLFCFYPCGFLYAAATYEPRRRRRTT